MQFVKKGTRLAAKHKYNVGLEDMIVSQYQIVFGGLYIYETNQRLFGGLFKVIEYTI